MYKSNAMLLIIILICAFSSGNIAGAQDEDDGVVTCPGFIESRLVVGGPARVTPGLPNIVRAQPSTSGEKIGEIPAEATFAVLAGPECDPEGYAWWQIDYEGLVGWTVEGRGAEYWLEPLDFANDGTITRWNARLLNMVNEFEGESNVSYGMALSQDGSLVALGTGYPENAVHVWRVESGEEVAVLNPEYGGDVRELAFSPDNRLLAISGLVGDNIQIWDVAGARNLRSLGVAGNDLAFSPVDNVLAYIQVFDIVLRNADTFQEMTRWKGIQGHGSALIYSPDGTLLIVLDVDGNVRLWDVEEQIEKHVFTHNGRVTGAAFTPDGSRLATVHCREEGDYSGSCLHLKIVFWDVASGERGQAIDVVVDGSVVFDARAQVAFSPDGSLLAMSESSRLWLFDVATGRQLVVHQPFPGWNVAFTPDGRRIIGAGTFSDVQVWGIP